MNSSNRRHGRRSVLATGPALAATWMLALSANADEAADRAAIEALNARWVAAYEAGEYAVIPPLYTEDALIMPRGRPAIEGRAALAERLGGLAAGRGVDIAFEVRELVVEGDLAWLVSRFAVTYTPPGQAAAAVTEHGRSLILYRRGADGAWRIHRDIDAPAPEPGGG